ncbi:DUF1614 domain-containing protein [bacterium]|nr:DUF1614 domain-containing protein [bacterium]
MIYLPVSILLFLVLLFVFPFVWAAIAIDAVEVAVAKLGFSPNVAFILFALVLIGGTINIPLYKTKSVVTVVSDFTELWLQQFWGIPLKQVQQETVIALNVGGGLIPALLAIFQLWRSDSLAILVVTAIVTVVSYYSAHIVPGIGIQMNALVAPLTASLSAVSIAGEAAPPVAFAGGVLGTLIGADLLHLKEVERMSPGVLSIGGAGVFDGIALCGLFALLLT